MRCPECGAPQVDGALFCSECGRFLAADQDTAVLPFSQFATRPLTAPLQSEGLAPADEPIKIIMYIAHNRQRVEFEITSHLRVGRTDYETGLVPELDLSPYNGAELGVSRNHALIQATVNGLIVIDQNSTNGTMINNNRLSPKRPYPIQNGDELRFGDLLVHIFIEENKTDS